MQTTFLHGAITQDETLCPALYSQYWSHQSDRDSDNNNDRCSNSNSDGESDMEWNTNGNKDRDRDTDSEETAKEAATML